MKESKPQAAQQDTEFSLTAVPESERKSYISLTIIWTGFVFVIVSMMAGGTLAVGLSFKEVIYATLIGNVFLCIIAVAVSVIASKTGLTFALLTRYSFGVMGSKVASIFVPIVNIGWYTIQAATYGHFVATALGMGEVGEAICMVLSAIAMGAFAFYGVKAITILGYVAIPAIVFLSIATTIRSMGVLGSWEALMAYRPSVPMTLAAGVTTVIGAWILSTATCIADIMRYARSTKEAVASALTGLLFGRLRSDERAAGLWPGHPGAHPHDDEHLHDERREPLLHEPEPRQQLQGGPEQDPHRGHRHLCAGHAAQALSGGLFLYLPEHPRQHRAAAGGHHSRGLLHHPQGQIRLA